MPTDAKQFFQENFVRLTSHGCSPYPWQTKLFLQMIDGDWPVVIDLPTGTGKTALVYVWLLALVWSLRNGLHNVPRRLVWVVNRRVVVDQVTVELEALLEKLNQLADLAVVLKSACVSGTALAISTLRGQRADTGDWRQDPTAPSVVVGTVDMIGSRLLFRGYRSGAYHRPIDAGLLGVDSLIVNDEAHLSPAFAELVKTIHEFKPSAGIPGKSFRIVLLSATQREDATGLRKFEHSPSEDAAANNHFKNVFDSPKRLRLEATERRLLDTTLWTLATEKPPRRTVVFIEKPEEAAQFRRRLEDGGLTAVLLTGTMRGLERDELASRGLKPFLEQKYEGPPIWLVTTSAGEVGIDLTCERMVTGLVEADRLLQRFGRLDRFGSGDGEAIVVYVPPPEKETRLVATLAYLNRLNGDVSCRSVWERRPPAEARSEAPALARLEPWRLEVWAQTSYRDRFVWPVAPWLHGQEDKETPETEVAWRDDVATLIEWEAPEEQIARVLNAYPVRSCETLREPSTRVRNKLETLAASTAIAAENPGVLVVATDGTVERRTLADVARKGDIQYKLLLLPSGLGRIDNGMFQAEKSREEEMAPYDVADHASNRRRFIVDGDEVAPVGRPPDTDVPGATRKERAEFARINQLRPPAVIKHPDDDGKELLYFGQSLQQASQRVEVELRAHSDAVMAKAKAMAEKAVLGVLSEVYAEAGRLHDDGKDHPVWRRAMGVPPGPPLAKVTAACNPRLLGGYRHEFGSLIKCEQDDPLLLHLIGSHHSAARPHFERNQLDRDVDTRVASETALAASRRFAVLQAKYGPWGLAYLEALFKCADGMVSREEGEPESE